MPMAENERVTTVGWRHLRLGVAALSETVDHGCVQVGRTRTALGEAWNRVLHAHFGRRSAHEAAA